MDFGGGFATGIAVGMGSGVATGISTGRKQAREQLRDHIEQNSITLQDRFGKPVKLDEFLDQVCGNPETNCSSANRKYALLAVGLAMLVAIAVFVYFLM